MNFLRRPAIALTFLLFACQANPLSQITVIDGGITSIIESRDRIPLTLLVQAGITPQPFDRVLSNGILLPIDQPLPEADFLQLQLRRAVPLTVNSPEGQQVVQSSALTVGQALSEAGIQFHASDLITPLPGTPIEGPLSITISPSKEMTIYAGNAVVKVRSSAGTVGEVLAEAGVPLIGLDSSSPLESELPPPDGQIRVIKINETVNVSLEQIPFTTQVIESPELPFGQEQTIQPGVNGLAMIRTRIRYEDGREVSRAAEKEVVIREPQARIVAGGSQIVLVPLPTGGVPADYWLALEMYATVYSPCKSGTGGCSYGTASGARAGKGIVAVDYSIYSYLAGMRVYVPGYGTATIGDTGGGPIIETALGVPRTRWIDLGFDEGGIVDMTGWVTVYFLAPAPAEIPYFLK